MSTTPERRKTPPLCLACGAEVTFAPSSKNPEKKVVLNREPDPKGNVILSEWDGAALFLGRDGIPPEGALRYTSHFATCKFASRFRRWG